MFEDHQKYRLEKQSAQILHRPFHLLSGTTQAPRRHLSLPRRYIRTVFPILQKIGRIVLVGILLNQDGNHISIILKRPIKRNEYYATLFECFLHYK